MGTFDVARAIDLVESVPPLCSTAQRVADLLGREGTPVAAVVQALSADDPLSMRVLHLVNDRRAAHAKVDDLAHAVQILGFDAIRSLVRSAAVTGAFKRFITPGLRPLWRRAYATAHGARELAAAMALGNPDDAFATGLVLNLGQMLLATLEPEAYVQVLVQATGPRGDLLEEERRSFGISHGDLGYMLGRRLQLPEVTVQVIRHHHAPAGALGHAPHAAVQYLADALATGLGVGLDPREQVSGAGMPAELWAELKVDTTMLRRAAMEEIACLDGFDGFYAVLGKEGLAGI